jgi:hypothetical protein
MESSAFIEIDMFPEEVNSMDHWEVVHFKGLLEEVAEEYHCSLVHFDIHHGTVIFSFDSDELMANILNILQNDNKDQP